MISWRDLSRFGRERDGRIGTRGGASEMGDARSRFTNGGNGWKERSLPIFSRPLDFESRPIDSEEG